MGNYRFRLSDMMPNAWFYKLKDMGSRRTRNQSTIHSPKKKQPTKTSTAATTTQTSSKPKQQPHFSQPRKSYYFTRDPIIQTDTTHRFYHNSPTNSSKLPDPPRKSSNKHQKTKRRKPTIKSSSFSSPQLVTSSVSAGCSCRATLDSVWTKTDSTPEYSASASVSPLDSSPEAEYSVFSNSCTCSRNSNATDIVIDMGTNSLTSKFKNLDGFESISELELPPILTKPAKFNDMIRDIEKKESKEQRSSVKFEETKPATLKEQRTSSSPSPVIRRFSANSQGMRLRVNSPKIGSMKKIQALQGRKSVSSSSISNSSSRKSISESFAIVKSSINPQGDFRDSMVEMIVENNIRASKDLEELLACYLSLNSDEYHDLIIKVFKQIWFDLTDIRMK